MTVADQTTDVIMAIVSDLVRSNVNVFFIDPLGQLTVPAISDHIFSHVFYPYFPLYLLYLISGLISNKAGAVFNDSLGQPTHNRQ